MADSSFEEYLTLLGGLLRLSRPRRDEIAVELRDHMEERLAELAAAGVPPAEAIARALEEFGDAAALAAQFISIVRNRRRRWVMRCTIGSVVTAVAVLILATAFWPEGDARFGNRFAQAQTKPVGDAKAEVAAPSVESQANAKAQLKLARSFNAEFEDTPLRDVFDYLADGAGVQIFAKWRQLDNLGVSKDSAVSLRLKDASFEMVLELVLDQVGDGVTFAIDRGIVIVSSKDDIGAKPAVEIYNVRDLLAKANLGPFSSGASLGVGMGGPAPDQPKPDKPADLTMTERADLLKATITSAVGSETWQEFGGMGTATIYNGLLVVKQTPAVQKDVAAFLKKLRETEAAAAPRDKW